MLISSNETKLIKKSEADVEQEEREREKNGRLSREGGRENKRE